MEILLVTVLVVDEVTAKGNVTACVPATAGADNVIVPLVSPEITIELIAPPILSLTARLQIDLTLRLQGLLTLRYSHLVLNSLR